MQDLILGVSHFSTPLRVLKIYDANDIDDENEEILLAANQASVAFIRYLKDTEGLSQLEELEIQRGRLFLNEFLVQGFIKALSKDAPCKNTLKKLRMPRLTEEHIEALKQVILPGAIVKAGQYTFAEW